MGAYWDYVIFLLKQLMLESGHDCHPLFIFTGDCEGETLGNVMWSNGCLDTAWVV